MDAEKVVCEVCHKEFKHRRNIYKHLRQQHGIDPGIQGKILCPEGVCKCSFKDYSSLRDHLNIVHKLSIPKEIHIFCNKTDFLQWKEHTEKKTKSFYATRSGRFLSDGSNKTYYICHRSGAKHRKPRARSNVKTRKIQNGVKMGSHCPSTMEVLVKDDKIIVHYYPKHFGHQRELRYLRISKSERSELAKKLSEGMSMDRCLEEVQNSLTDELERIHLLTRKDLRNIFNTTGVNQQDRRFSNVVASIEKWVKDDEASQRNLSIFYKPQGSPHLPLNEEDLILVIMSPPQKEMYMKFCSEKICIVSTHGTNTCDFQLTTIGVFDEFDALFPAAFCLSNRVDENALGVFFDAVTEATTPATPEVFISDDAQLFYNAWKAVNGEAKHLLLCTRSVERNWRKALLKISSKEKKVNVFKLARSLLEEMDVGKFRILLKGFLRELASDNETKRFGVYFEKVYASRPEVWALCYRVGSEVNANMFSEDIKNMFEKHKRLDLCLDHLLKMVRDKIFSRLTQLVEDDESSMLSIIQDIIHDRHEKSLDLLFTIESVNSTSWEIKSANQASSDVFMVSKVIENCDSCPLICFHCKVCIHKYECTCLDYNIDLNMCAHIHFVLSSLFLNEVEAPVLEELPVETEIQKITSISLTPESTTLDLQQKFDLASSLIQDNKCDTETSQKINKLMDNAINLLSTIGKRKVDLPDESVNEPPNKIKLPVFFFKKMCT